MKRIMLKIVIAYSILLIAVGVYINFNKPPVKTYTVTFITDGVVYLEPLKVNEGSTVKRPTVPEKSGYSFVSWQLEGTDYDFNDKVTKDITLTAVWVPVDNNIE